MDKNNVSRKEFLKLIGAGLSIPALADFNRAVEAFAAGAKTVPAPAPSCPVDGSILGDYFLFLTGSFLEVSLKKNPSIKTNQALGAMIDKMILKKMDPEKINLPYAGSSASNWVFAFDLGCAEDKPLLIELANSKGDILNEPLMHRKGTTYAAVFNDPDSKVLNQICTGGEATTLTLSIKEDGGATLWQSSKVRVYITTSSGGSGRDSNGSGSSGSSGASGSGGSSGSGSSGASGASGSGGASGSSGSNW